jgi:hypothetical protein
MLNGEENSAMTETEPACDMYHEDTRIEQEMMETDI